MVKTQLVDQLGRNIGGVPTPTITNVVPTSQIPITPTPVPTTVAPSPIAPAPVVKTPTPVVPEYQLPESVTGKPVISPTLQAKIDAKKTPINPVVPTTPTPTPEITPVLAGTEKPVETTPITPAPAPTQISEAEKQAQATGVKYKMVDGTPLYSPANNAEALKILQSGGKFEAENGMSAVAKAQIEKYRKLAQLTDTQLSQNIVNGTVSSRELEQINSINPELVNRAKEMSRKGTITETANEIQAQNNAIVTGQEKEVQSKALTNLLGRLEELQANAESYGDIKARVYANYPDMEVARNEIVNGQKQLRQLQRAKRQVFEDYKKQNSSLPISMIMAGYSALSRDLDNQIYEVNDTLNQNISLFNSYLDEAKSEIDWEVQNQQKEEQRLFDLYGVMRPEEIRQEDFARADKKLADEIARTDKKDKEKLAQLEQERNDVVRKAIAQLGVKPVGETYDELLGEYATAVKNQPPENKFIQTDKPIYDTATGKWIMPPGAEPTRQSPAPSREPTIKSSFTPEGTFKVDIANGATPRKSSRGYYECAMLVNDTLGTAMPDLHVDKLKYNNSDVPVVGGAFIEKTNDKYGHTGIIESINPNGTLNIVETNYPVGSGVRRTTIDPSKRNIVGYYNPQTAGKAGESIKDFTSDEVALFNSSKYNPQTDKNASRVDRYEKYQNALALLQSDENAPTEDLMAATRGLKSLDATANKAYKDMSLVVGQLEGLKSSIDKYNKDKVFGDYLSPISGLIANNNPWNTKAADVKARLQAVVPKVARGIFGEVGVLTDQDIANYIQTLPNIKQTADVQDVVQLALLGTLKNALDSAVRQDASTYNVSGMVGNYKKISNKIRELENSVSGTQETNTPPKENIFQQTQTSNTVNPDSIWQ